MGVTTTKRELHVWLASEKPHKKFQAPIWDSVENNPGKLISDRWTRNSGAVVKKNTKRELDK
jgi:hypothetical protein